jgi:SHAQKYF class myb-like DNA-binding protein
MKKPRQSWTDKEHTLFMEAVGLFERDWKRIQGHIGTWFVCVLFVL